MLFYVRHKQCSLSIALTLPHVTTLYQPKENLEATLKYFAVMDTQRERIPSDEAPVLSESMNMKCWVFGTSNRLFIKGFLTEVKFPRKQTSYWRQNVVPRDSSNLLYPFYLSKHRLVAGNFVWKHGLCNLSIFN